jgi:hypothetical protein
MATATLTARRNQNLYRQPTKLVLGPSSATFGIIAIISLFALVYLNQITKTGTFGYRLTALQQQRNQISAQNQELGVEAARLASLQQVQAAPNVAKMVPSTREQISYASR